MRTKVIATLGPSSMEYEVMRAMVEYGVRIFRLNFSHGGAGSFAEAIQNIRRLEREMDLPLTAMGDLSGPKIRIGRVDGSPVQVTKGDPVFLGLPDHRDQAGGKIFLSLEQPALLRGLGKGMAVTLSDGMLRFEVEEVHRDDALFELKAQNDGLLSSHKGIAFPGRSLDLPALTEKDFQDLYEGLDLGLDAVALSFVQRREDVDELRYEIRKRGRWVPVVAKVERQDAMDNLDAIVALADVVMVARGDLGVECPMSCVPVLQKKIIRATRHGQKASIVATQMLLSMVKSPIPTRAESADVANAILDGADCVMLSEETAIGDYPVEAVKVIRDISQSAEAYYLERTQGPFVPKKERNPVKYLTYAASLLAENLDSAALVCHTSSGSTARLLASRRPKQPIYGLTPTPAVVKMLNFFWGVRPRLVEETVASHLERAEQFVETLEDIKHGESVVITSGQPTPGQTKVHTNELKIYYK